MMDVNGFIFDASTGRYYKTIVANAQSQSILLDSDCVGDTVYRDIQIEEGDRPTGYVKPETYSTDGGGIIEKINNLNDKVDQKADSNLTEEQIKYLNEETERVKAELEALASMSAVSELLKRFEDFQKMDRLAWEASEKETIQILSKVVKNTTKLEGMAQQWEDVNGFMRFADEGLLLGKHDGSASINVSTSGRITINSNGKPAMYVDGDTIHIENGIFTKSLYLGAYRIGPHESNPNAIICRKVGLFNL